MNTSYITNRIVLGILIGLTFLGAYSVPASGHFTITYYDNYNYQTSQWDAWQSDETPSDAWDDKYLADDSSEHTEFTDHAFTSISSFNLRGGLWSKDGHDAGGEDWNPIKSIGDNASGQSAHHVFAALFQGPVYLEEGDVLRVASDDDVYIFLDDDTAWGQEILSDPGIHYFGDVSTTITAAQAGYHEMTVKFIERCDIHSGIEITLNGEHLENAKVPVDIDIKPGSCPNPLNVKDQGVIPVAILGTEDFDVFTLDPTSAHLEGVAPLRSSYEDVSTPVSNTEKCACTTAGPDGYLDLTLKFDAQEVVDALGYVNDGELLSLTLTVEDNEGVLMAGRDCVVIIEEQAKNPKKALVGHWKLDETSGSTAYDSSDNGNNGSVNGDLLWQPNDGRIDGALLLDGDEDYVSLPIGSLISQLTNCTIATWVNWSGQGGDWQRIFDFGSDENVNMFLTPSIGSDGPMRFAITTGGWSNEEQVTAYDILPTGWHHVCVTINADYGIITLYLDGSEVAENPTTTLTPSDLGTTSQNWLGRSQYSADAYFDGMLDDFRIYDQALSPGDL